MSKILIKLKSQGDIVKNVGLVLQGGGMRGVYTSGVLDFFMEKLIKMILWHD